MSATPKTFKAGQELSTRSACDYNCKYWGTVISRTAKRVKIDLGLHYGIVTVGIIIDRDGNERCYPHGRYSMAPTFCALSDQPENVIQFA